MQIHDTEHVIGENDRHCWCNPTILHREDKEDDIIVHFNVGQPRVLTTEDVDNILKVVEDYERNGGNVDMEGAHSYNREKAP